MTLMVSLLDADQVELGIDRFPHALEDHQGYFDRKIARSTRGQCQACVKASF